MTTPSDHLIGFGNDELEEKPIVRTGDKIRCPACGEIHVLFPPDDLDDRLLFFNCGAHTFLAAVNYRLVMGEPYFE